MSSKYAILFTLPLTLLDTSVLIEELNASNTSNLLSNSEPVASKLTNLPFTDDEYSVTLPIPLIVEELIEPVTAKSLFNSILWFASLQLIVTFAPSILIPAPFAVALSVEPLANVMFLSTTFNIVDWIAVCVPCTVKFP